MKIYKMFLSIFIILLGLNCLAQAPDTLWTKTYGGQYYDWGRNLDLTADGSCIIVGSTELNGSGHQNIWLLRTDGFGDTLWTENYGGDENSGGYSVQQTSDSGFVVAGYITDANDNTDICLVKTDNNGNQEWLKCYGGHEYEIAKYVSETPDNGFIICGGTYSYGNGRSDIYLIKTDQDGDILWTRTFGGADREGCNCVQPTSDGGYILTGQSISYGPGGQDVWLIKTDSKGNIEWDKLHGGGSDEQAYCVRQTPDGGYVFVAFTKSYSGDGSQDYWLVKTDRNGNIEWNKTFGGSGMDHPECVFQTSDYGFIITGYTDSFGAGSYDLWIVKTDSLGNELWNKALGGPYDDRGYAVQQTDDGGYILAGKTESFGNGSSDVWLLKLNSELNNDLVAYYPFDGNANDESGNGNHGIIYGATLATDRFGNENSAYSFDGTDDYIDIGPGIDIGEPNSPFTVSVWFKDSSDDYGVLFTDYDATRGDSSFTVHLSINYDSTGHVTTLSRGLNDLSPPHFRSYRMVSKAGNLNYYNWHNAIYIADGISKLSLYIDGELDSEMSYSPELNYIDDPYWRIGVSRWENSFDESYYFGLVDDITVYSKELNNVEIDSIFHIGGWAEQVDTSCVAYYPFNGSADDESNNGNNGTINGATLTNDRFGQEYCAYEFDGNDDYILIPYDNILSSNDQSISLFFKAKPVLSDDFGKGIIHKGDNRNIEYSVWLNSVSGLLYYKITKLLSETSTASGNTNTYIAENDSNWHHLVTVKKSLNNGDSLSLYVDGVLRSHTNEFNFHGEQNNYDVFIGRNSSHFFSGKIDDIRIFNNTLAKYEVDWLYHEKGWHTPPKTPNNLICFPDYHKITLQWDRSGDSDLREYKIYRGLISPATLLIDSIIGTPPDSFYIDTNLVNGQTYYYRVTAVDFENMESNFSNEVSAIPGDYTSPEITIISPTEDFSIPEYEPLTVQWTATDNVAMDSIQIIYSSDPNSVSPRRSASV